MSDWLDVNSMNTFSAFSPSHLIALTVFVVLAAVLFAGRNWLKHEQRRTLARVVLAGVLILCEGSLNVWYVSEGIYSARDTLPLELCSISLYMCVVMLLLRSRAIFQIVYFTGIGGATLALLTPVLFYDFPHFRFIEFFVAHFFIILSALYMVWVEGCRPTLKSVGITMIFLNVLLPIIYVINTMTGGNYMFLSRKPETASPLDYLGPHPWYLLSMEAVALIIFLLLYLPFAMSKGTKHPKHSIDA